MNAGKRIFPHHDSGAVVWHTYRRILDWQYVMNAESKDFMLKTIRAYEDLPGVEVLTFCLMDNHFHLLLRVPHRPEGLEVPLEVILARMERAVGEDSMKLVRRDLGFWETMQKRSDLIEKTLAPFWKKPHHRLPAGERQRGLLKAFNNTKTQPMQKHHAKTQRSY